MNIIFNRTRKSTLFIFLLFGFLTTGCAQKGIAKFENRRINQSDLDNVKAIEESYGGEISDDDAFLYLIRRLINVKLAKNMSIIITREDIEKEAERIDRETKAPEVLNKIKKHFSGNTEKYFNLFIKPELSRSLVEDKFFYDTIIYQKIPYSESKTLLKDLNKGKYNKNTSKDGFKHFKIYEDDTTTNYIYNYFKYKLINKSDSFHIIEDKFTYFVVRKNGSAYEGFSILKEDFNNFYWEKIEKMNIIVYDNKLCDKLRNRLKNTQWEKVIKFVTDH